MIEHDILMSCSVRYTQLKQYKLVEVYDITGLGKNNIFIGEVQLTHVEENYHLLDKMCSLDGFMFNINSAQNLKSDERTPYAKAYLTPFDK